MEKIPTGGILCERDKIIAIGGASAFSLLEEGLEIYHLEDCYALPGFIDSHIHGIGDFDAGRPDAAGDTLHCMSAQLVKRGVTSFCPTIVSKPPEVLLPAIGLLADMVDRGFQAADGAALHIEGPFINKAKRGSQNPDAIRETVDLGFAREIIEAGRGRIKLMTFAPELEHADKLVELMLENGVIPSMGHSLADERDTLRCIDAGARRCTYIFNGMPQLYHRESSLTTIALLDDRVAVEMICDGTHLHPRFVDLTARCKPFDKIIGISNAVASPDLPAADRQAGPDASERPGAIVRGSDGIITGAVMTLENSWRHLMSYSGMDTSRAAACFTSNPAADLGLITRGELRPGRRADIAFFDSKTNRVRLTVVRGNLIYRAEEEHE